MSRSLVRAALCTGFVALVSVVALTGWDFTMAAETKSETHVVHNVFFALNDNSPAGKQKLVDACKKYLTGHEGTVYFSAGVLCDKLNRPVNDREWDVGLHIVFRSMADHDRYQDHPRHTQFIDENKASWKKVRVFDSDVHP